MAEDDQEMRACVSRYFILPEQVNTYVFPRRDKKSDCKRVCVKKLKMCFHIYTHGAQQSRHSGCVSTNNRERTCVSSLKHQNGKRTRLCFQLSSPLCLGGNTHVWKMCFLCVCVSSRLKSVAVFLAQAHPNRYFCQKLSTFRDQKLRKRHAARKAEGCGRMRKDAEAYSQT